MPAASAALRERDDLAQGKCTRASKFIQHRIAQIAERPKRGRVSRGWPWDAAR